MKHANSHVIDSSRFTVATPFSHAGCRSANDGGPGMQSFGSMSGHMTVEFIAVVSPMRLKWLSK